MISSQPYVHPKAARLLELQEWSIKTTKVDKEGTTTPTFKRAERASWGMVALIAAGTIVTIAVAAKYAQHKLDEHL